MSDGQRVAGEGQRASPSPGEGKAVPHHPAGHHTTGCRMEDCLEMLGRGPKGLKTDSRVQQSPALTAGLVSPSVVVSWCNLHIHSQGRSFWAPPCPQAPK